MVTYPTGDSTQGRFKMTLSDLQNEHYTVAVREEDDGPDIGSL